MLFAAYKLIHFKEGEIFWLITAFQAFLYFTQAFLLSDENLEIHVCLPEGNTIYNGARSLIQGGASRP